jgi:hypothetical protein
MFVYKLKQAAAEDILDFPTYPTDNPVFVGSEVFTEVTMKYAVLWDVAQYRSCQNRRFGVTCFLYLKGRNNFLP